MDPRPRIAPADPPGPQAAQALARLLPAGLRPPNLFLTVARNEGLLAFLVESGLLGLTGMLDRRTLPRALRECVILRTCVAAGNDYEFNLHVQTLSARMGLSAAQIDDVRRGQPQASLWTPGELAAMRLVDGLARRLAVDDATFAAAREEFDEPTLIELTQLVGLYTGVAMLCALARPAFDAYRPGPPVRATTAA